MIDTSREEDGTTVDRFADHWLWAALGEPVSPQIANSPERPVAPVASAMPPVEGHINGSSPIASKFNEAATLHRRGHWEEALALYEQVPESDHNHVAALANRIAIGAARKDYSKLRQYGDELLKINPESLPALEALMQSAMATGDYNAAALYGAQLVKHDAKSHQAWFNLGLCYQKTSQPERAEQAYTEAIGIEPDGIRAHTNLGVLLQTQGKTSRARREFERALEIEPEHLATLWNLALTNEKAGQVAKAEKVYLRLIREEYQVYTVAFRLGRLRLNRKNYLGAVQAFERCLLERSEDAAAKVHLALAKRRSGGLEDPTYAPGDGDADSLESLVLQAALAVEAKDWKAASDIEAKLSRLGEDTAILAYDIGVLQQRENLLPEAIRSYEKASGQRPGFAEALWNRGHALMQSGEAEQARAAWKEAIEVKPAIVTGYFTGAAVSEVPG